MIKFIERHVWLLELGLFCLALSFQQYASTCYPGISFDSAQYQAAAKSWQANQTLQMADGSLYAPYPPLFPIVLSIIADNLPQGVSYLNALSFMISLMVLYYGLAKRLILGKYWQVLFLLSLVLATPLYLIHHFFWSEPLFLLMIGLSFYSFYSYLLGGATHHLIILSILGLLMSSQRNAGLIWIMGFGLVIFIYSPTSQKVLHSIIYVFPGLLFSLGWIFRNLYFTNASYRSVSDGNFLQGLLHNGYEYTQGLSIWFAPAALPYILRLGILLGVCGFLFWFHYQDRQLKTPKEKLLQALLIVLIIYSGALHLIDPKAVYPADVERFLAIILPYAFLLIICPISREFQYFSKYLKATCYFLLGCWLFYNGLRTVKNLRFWHQVGCNQTLGIVSSPRNLKTKTSPHSYHNIFWSNEDSTSILSHDYNTGSRTNHSK